MWNIKWLGRCGNYVGPVAMRRINQLYWMPSTLMRSRSKKLITTSEIWEIIPHLMYREIIYVEYQVCNKYTYAYNLYYLKMPVTAIIFLISTSLFKHLLIPLSAKNKYTLVQTITQYFFHMLQSFTTKRISTSSFMMPFWSQ